ncbi:MAG: chain length determinant protein tyrosine kinase EpsG [Methylomonas sp.]|jgi:chain length determinant protein tyrosine kinase EpsG|nr:MAG: chain length determinant protein tyrosine kinase EpsG [Methylomonas sp.]
MTNPIIKSDCTASIGALLLDAGKISISDAERIIALQKQNNMRFGDVAKSLGLVSEDDIQKALSLQFNFPYLLASEDNFSQELIAAYQPFSSQVEALRAVRGQLMLRWFNDVQKSLTVISPNRSEGRSYTAANLAIVFSQLGERTLLIDADFRQPRQHSLFKLQTDYGLSDILAGRADSSVISRVNAFRDLCVLPAGTLPPNPVDLITRGLKNFLQPLHQQFDVILIDTPATEQGIEAKIIASTCGAALLVARQHHSRVNALQQLSGDLLSSGCPCVGSVINVF